LHAVAYKKLWVGAFAGFILFIALFFNSPTDLGLSSNPDNRQIFSNGWGLLPPSEFRGLNYAIFTGSLLISIAILICSIRDIKKNLPISRRYAALLLAILFLALLLRIYHPSKGVDWVRMDMYLYAQRNDGIINLRGIGWSYMVGYATIFLSPAYSTLINLTLIAGTVTVLAAFALSYLLFKDTNTAIITSLLFAVSPSMIMASKDGGYTTPAIFFALLTFAALMLYIRSRQIRFLAVSTLLLVTMQIRPEYFFVVFIYFFAAAVLLMKEDYRKASAIFLCFSILAMPYTTKFLIASKHDTRDKDLYGVAITEQDSIHPYAANAFRLITENLSKNLLVFLNNRNIALPETLLAILGVWALMQQKNRRPGLYVLLAYFLVYFAIVSLIHKEGFFTDPKKYQPSALAPMLILAGAGFSKLKDITKKRKLLPLLLAIAVIYSYTHTHSGTHDKYSTAKYLEYETLLNHTKDIDQSCTVIYPGDSLMPNTFAMKRIELLRDTALQAFLDGPKKSGCFYLYGGYRDPYDLEYPNSIDPEQMLDAFNRTYSIRKIFDAELLKEYRPMRGRNFLYAFNYSGVGQ